MRSRLFGAVVLATTGCVSTNASLLNPSVTYQKICPDGVQIFTSAERVRGDYYEVAILNSKGESSWTDERQMTASQRSKAARLGANGIILGEVKEPKAGTKIIGSILGTGAERKGAGVAIYIPADSNRVRRACSGKAAGNPATVDEDQPAPVAFGVAAPQDPPPPSTPATQRPAPVSARLAPPESPRPAAPAAPGVAAMGEPEPPIDAPVGTRYVADTEKKTYLPVQCTTFIREVVPQNRYYYQTEAAAQADGYRRSEQC